MDGYLAQLDKICDLADKYDALVVVDDSPAFGNLTQSENESKPTWKILNSPAPSIGGKGFLVHEYAKHVGAKIVFSHYQAAWNNFNN